MTDRKAELRELAADLTEHDRITDAFLAKSFTDQLLIVDVSDGESIPPALADRLAEHDLRPADAVYEDADGGRSTLGDVGSATRHHFVDVRTRGSHRSYVVE